jgi:paraquat-inducible protein A
MKDTIKAMESTTQILGCHCCHQVHTVDAFEINLERIKCTRCGAKLHHRKPNSLSRSWALLIAAAVLYIPANTYPIMTVRELGNGTPDTILSGVARLFESGLWPLAVLVFVASVAIPILKILTLGYLLGSVRGAARLDLVARTRLYRLIELVGRWSMVDIFMVSILIALVRLGNLAEITPGVGALAFASVVVLTMLSAMSFDPRLMWDKLRKTPNP